VRLELELDMGLDMGLRLKLRLRLNKIVSKEVDEGKVLPVCVDSQFSACLHEKLAIRIIEFKMHFNVNITPRFLGS
jgi:hypothetical protein